MGTMTEGVSVSQASSATILILMGWRSQREGRETIFCGGCGRAQFDKGQTVCVACRRPLLAALEPLCDSDAQPKKKCRRRIPRAIGSRLRKLRHALDMTQGALARTLDSPRSYISKLEGDKIVPNINSLERVAGALRVTMGELLDDSITVEELAMYSLLRSPNDGELMGLLVGCLPRLGQDSRAILIQLAGSFHSSDLAR